MAGARLPMPAGRASVAVRRELTRAFLEAFGVKGERARSLLLAGKSAALER
jgi:hypothetical protein